MTGQAGPHVYISADMEGITGLVDAQDVQPGGADYERGRVMMTEDVNAAIGGVHAAWGEGTGITVNDAHGPMRNILPELLHPAARLIRGKPKPMGMLAGLDGSQAHSGCSATRSWATRSTHAPSRSAGSCRICTGCSGCSCGWPPH